MDLDELEIVEMELKYCERCGGLWMRMRGDDGVYCVKCAPEMEQLPLPRRLKQEIEACVSEQVFLCRDGGNA